MSDMANSGTVVESSLSQGSSGDMLSHSEVVSTSASDLAGASELAAASDTITHAVHGSSDPLPNTVPDGAKAPDEDLPTPGSWSDFFNGLDLKGVIHNVASHFELIQAYDRTLCFAIASENATLYNERHQRGLASAIELRLEQPVEVVVSIQPTTNNTPARHREILEQQRLKAAQTALEEDDFLSALLADFDAAIIPNTVRPPLAEL